MCVLPHDCKAQCVGASGLVSHGSWKYKLGVEAGIGLLRMYFDKGDLFYQVVLERKDGKRGGVCSAAGLTLMIRIEWIVFDIGIFDGGSWGLRQGEDWS